MGVLGNPTNLGRYLHRPGLPGPVEHTCPLPAEWPDAAVWRCPAGHLWTIVTPPQPFRHGYTVVVNQWRPASWWQRQRYRRHDVCRARPEMANDNQAKTFKHLRPPPPRSAPPTTGRPQTPGGVVK